MAQQVIKRNGAKEPFDEKKVRRSIEMAANEAGLADGRSVMVVGQVVNAALALAASKDEIATSEIRDIILSQLDQVEPSAAAAWRKHYKGEA